MSAFERFWSLVDIRDARECWNWTGSTNHLGYGVPDAGVQVAYGEPLSHRVACAMTRPRSEGQGDVLHGCDNPACCNPRHLRWGSHLENMQDKHVAEWVRSVANSKIAGGPFPGGPVEPSPRAPEVVRQGLRRIDDDTVRAIRADHASGMTARALAQKYGVTQSHADNIAKRRIHKKVANPTNRRHRGMEFHFKWHTATDKRLIARPNGHTRRSRTSR